MDDEKLIELHEGDDILGDGSIASDCTVKVNAKEKTVEVNFGTFVTTQKNINRFGSKEAFVDAVKKAVIYCNTNPTKSDENDYLEGLYDGLNNTNNTDEIEI